MQLFRFSICSGFSHASVMQALQAFDVCDVQCPLRSMSTVWCLCYLFYIAFTYFAVLNAPWPTELALFCILFGCKCKHRQSYFGVVLRLCKHACGFGGKLRSSSRCLRLCSPVSGFLHHKVLESFAGSYWRVLSKCHRRKAAFHGSTF